MSKSLNISLGLLFGIAWGLVTWFIFHRFDYAILNGVCLSAGWFSGELIKWIRKRNRA